MLRGMKVMEAKVLGQGRRRNRMRCSRLDTCVDIVPCGRQVRGSKESDKTVADNGGCTPYRFVVYNQDARNERASYNGSIEASQASDVGSIPIARSRFKRSRP
jgi:hypothetical protein